MARANWSRPKEREGGDGPFTKSTVGSFYPPDYYRAATARRQMGGGRKAMMRRWDFCSPSSPPWWRPPPPPTTSLPASVTNIFRLNNKRRINSLPRVELLTVGRPEPDWLAAPISNHTNPSNSSYLQLRNHCHRASSYCQTHGWQTTTVWNDISTYDSKDLLWKKLQYPCCISLHVWESVINVKSLINIIGFWYKNLPMYFLHY